jgi:DNA-binding XRE family transcriptional regulator
MSGAVVLNRGIKHLLTRARMTVGMSQEKLGTLLGVSKRTMGRSEAGQAPMSVAATITLARLVHPHDPELARELAAAASETLESLGLVEPAAEKRPTKLVVDAVVCVAAESLGIAPGPVRGALHAAFKRTRELGLTLEEVEAGLERAAPPVARAKSGAE